MYYFLKKGFILILFLVFLLYPSSILAEDFTTDYEVNYYLKEGSNNVQSNVEFNIKLTNKTSTVYVKKFGISFPNNFQIKNIKAQDDRGTISPVVTKESKSNRIELEFTNPSIGKNTVNNFYLQFNQDNLFKINGNVWEVILPTIENIGDSNYKVIVHLPNNTDRKISIAKPNPDLVTGNQIIWNNPKTRTVYAVFGESQYYDSELIYHLINPKLTPVYTEVAFPPDTLFQKIYISSISPKPNLTYLDEDGNFMGRYYLNPKENKTVRFKGTIEVFVKPRQSMLTYIQSKIENQKKYLFNETKYWKLSDFNQIASLTNPQDIYEFTRDSFEYNYNKLEGDNKRLGAELALKNPSKAVCVEYSDLFIAISREKGIPSREIQGYGLSQDPQLRPLSLTADILHSWPEYFDSISKQWKSVDPTWENTSGIDYFSSFDLNHIVFAIHGKRPDYPLPAGMYKQEDSQDILIKATKNIPEELIQISIKSTNFPKNINDKEKYTSKISILNNSNVFLTDIPLKISAPNLSIDKYNKSIDILAPYEEKTVEVVYFSKQKNIKYLTVLDISLFDETMFTTNISVVPYIFDMGIKVVFVLFALLIIAFLFLLIKRIKK